MRTLALLVLPIRMNVIALTLISAVLGPLCKPVCRDLVNSSWQPGLGCPLHQKLGGVLGCILMEQLR